MAEVGVLDLQIHDNSAKAAEGLNSLASALERVRSAVGTGKQLSGVSKDIEKINAAVSGVSGGKASKSLGGIEKAVDSAKKAASGFVEVSSRIEESMSNVGNAVADASKDISTYTSSVKEAEKASAAVAKTAKKAWSTYNPKTGGYDLSPDIKSVADVYASADRAQMEAARVNGIKRQLSELRYGLDNPAPMNYADFLNQSMNIEGPVKSAKESMSAFLGAFEDMDSMTETEAAIAKLNPELQDLATNGQSSKTVIQRLKEAFFGADSEAKSFGDAVSGMLPSLSSLSKQLMSIARRMALRAVIKQVTAGFKEGISNLYQYSNAVGTSFAPAMDSAASTMLQFKNSIGAAVAPAIEALIPVLQTVVDWMITAINYVNQFLALISGKGGWTKAVPAAASAFDEASKKAKGAGGSAKKAAKDVKELLADWDELNIIQSQTGSGGGGGGGGGGAGAGLGSEFSSMFEEVRGFDKEVQAFVKNLKDEFGSVLGFVTEIGAAVLAWKVSSVFSGIIGTLAGIAGTAIALDLVIKTTGVFDKTFLDTGSEGWLIGSILTPVIGGIFAKQILSKVISGSVGKLAIPLMLTVSSVVDVVTLAGRTDVSALDKKSLELSVVSALKAGGAAAYFAHTLGGYSLGGSIAGGAAVAIATFGVAIGIKAIAQTAKSGITEENIKAAALSSLAIGLGAGTFAKIAGATAAGALGIGGVAAGAALLTLAVGIGIAATIANKPKAIEWGDYNATEEEIKNFVEGSAFNVKANTILSLIDPKIEAVSSSEKSLTATADEVKLNIGKLLLGIDDTDTLKELEKQILGSGEGDTDSLIGKLRQTMKDKNNVIETGLTIQFTNYGNGKTDSSKEAQEQFKTITAGWDVIDKEITSLGKQLSESFGRAYREGITEEAKAAELKTISELTQMIANVAAAISNGEAWADAQINLKSNLGNLTSESFGEVVEYISQYKNDVVSAYTKAYDEVTKQIGGQAAGLMQSYENELTLAGKTKGAESEEHKRNAEAYKKQYDQTYALYQSRMAGRDAAIEDWMSNAMDNDTLKMVRDAITGKLQGQAGADSIGAAYQDALMNALHGGTAQEQTSAMTDLLNGMIDNYFGADAGTIKALVKEGILGYEDVISEEAIRLLHDTSGVYNEDLESAWQEVINQLFTHDTEPTETEPINVEVPIETDIKEAASEASTTEEILGGLSTEAEMNLAETDSVITTHAFPATSTVDTSATTSATSQMAAQVHSDVVSVINDLNWLNSYGGGSFYKPSFGGIGGIKMATKATGGNIRSGEAFFANENGTIEMMGKMGNSAVVANNQQIVEGISRGVAASNSGMENSMNMMVALMRQFVAKEFTAKVVPSSSMGRNNAMSSEMYRKVTG